MPTTVNRIWLLLVATNIDKKETHAARAHHKTHRYVRALDCTAIKRMTLNIRSKHRIVEMKA